MKCSRAQLLIAFLATLSVFFLSACGGVRPGGNQGGNIPTLSFTASASSINAGQPVTLTWQSSHATSVTISAVGADGSSRSISTNSQLSGSAQDMPTQNTTYTAVAAGAGGTSTQQQVKVTVSQLTPTLTFSVDKNSVTAGQPITLTWQMTNGTSITISAARADGSTKQILAPTSQASGTVSDSPTQDTTYTAVASGNGGTSAQQQVKVAVTEPPPTLTFSADKTSVDFQQTVTLSWQTTNATSITITAARADGSTQTIFPSKSQASGTVTDNPTQNTTYTAIATGAGNTSVQQQVQVTVAKPVAPTITQFSANPTDVAVGNSTTLTWDTSNATSITITPTLPQVDGEESGPLPVSNTKGISIPVSTTGPTTYTMTATGPGGTSQPSTVTITAINMNLTVTPATVSPNTPNEQVTISWNVSGGTVTALSIDNGVCSACALPQGSFTLPTPPSATTTFTATASLQDGAQVQQTVTVTVGSPASGVIKHVFFMLQENRSFDMYLGMLKAYRTQRLQQAGIQPNPSDTINVFDPNVVLTNHHTNVKVKPFHEQTERTEDLTPSWDESHHNVALAGGDPAWQTTSSYKNSMFSMSNFLDTPNGAIGGTSTIDPNATRAMGYYDQDDLPYYYDLATFFATSDSWFSPVLTQTIPNRMFLFTGSSFGHEYADQGGHPLYSPKTIFRAMNEAHVSWLYFNNGGVFLAEFQDWNTPGVQSQVKDISALIGSGGTGGILQGNCSGTQCDPDKALPQVIFIDDPSKGLNEHPEDNIQQGAAYVQSIISALMNSDAWQDSVFILTYDEGGGLYDHVPPIMVPPPDQYEQGQCPDPNNGSAEYCKLGLLSAPTSAQGGYDMFNLSGFRVPVIVISPYAKPNYISHQPMDYTAILAFIESTFNIPACGTGTSPCGLTKRDQWWLNKGDMQDFFNFSSPALLNAPNGKPWTSFLPTQPTSGTDNVNLETGGIQ